MNRALSSDEILKITSPISYPIYTYNELQNAKSVDQIFGGNDGVIILYETDDGYGHWVCLIRHPYSRTIEFFDSYGFKPDDERQYIPPARWIYQFLTRLLFYSARRGWKIEYNEIPFQKINDRSDNTCGRWVGFRLLNKNSNLTQFQNFFKSQNNPSKTIVFLTQKYI